MWKKLASTIFALTLGTSALDSTGAGAGHGSSRLVHFENSCSSYAAGQIDQGVTLLHSFEYPETTRIFGQLLEREPDCAMAYWGAAMSLWHPLWAPPDVDSLKQGAKLLQRARLIEATPREQAYIKALAAFFADTDPGTHATRVDAYEAAMGGIYEDYRDSDQESAMFYALALLASADPRDKTYSNQFRAAGLLNWVKESQPEHPGVLHYIIHSYDYPGLAHLALNAAKTYAEAAPDSAHAQHMPSHIFTRLGLWERSIASNHDSTRSAADYTERAHLSGHYDEGLHSMDYLMYALLQTARDEEAAALLATLERIDRTNTENFKVAYTYASSPARFVLERRAWSEAAELELVRVNFPWDDFGYARSIHHFARGIGAARSGKPGRAQAEMDEIRTIQGNLPETTLTYWREQVQVHLDALKAWIFFTEGRVEEALDSARRAADREDAVDKHPVTPGEVLPARELYADLLLESGKPALALREYQTVLDNSPNRLNALIGARAAAIASGQTELAGTYQDIILEQVVHGSGRGRAGS